MRADPKGGALNHAWVPTENTFGVTCRSRYKNIHTHTHTPAADLQLHNDSRERQRRVARDPETQSSLAGAQCCAYDRDPDDAEAA